MAQLPPPPPPRIHTEIYIYICIDKVDGDLLREQGGDGHVDDTYFYPLTRLLSL